MEQRFYYSEVIADLIYIFGQRHGGDECDNKKFTEIISLEVCRSDLLPTWRIHPIFHVST